MRSKGVLYKDIHKSIAKKGYTGSQAAIRQFIAKEKRLQKDVEDYDDAGSSEIIERKWLLKLLYKPLEKVKQLTDEQVQNAFRKYPLFKQLYDLVWSFKSILLSGQREKLHTWINKVQTLELTKLNSFLNGLKRDINAVENAFLFSYSNGLAEGSVNKLKTIKRIMYGRFSFDLLRNKLLLLESRKFN
ncbi:transposase [Virgibacillus chiguensis]|uniref:transposase n=1 Tax=Virgibacillus chiguensis TaxID=411959 RepID=UPI000A04CDFF|nr:transposase [Virgibacillus chiguensis]